MTKKHLDDLQGRLNTLYVHIQSGQEQNAVVRTVSMNAFMRFYNEMESFCYRWNLGFDANRFYSAVFGGSR